ncbi:hypothetical protein LZ11_01675 [Thermosediminibacter litoriperuensis]|uniref:Polymerase beta nucleotidyltransferase domain-containing protein n=1 Tax=Thermosediminibacter litoriperuensis TaxID=291989 RepID=A0A5S5AM79_9FIRM|nr:hypothetical protein LZ11_01675 [Thermosediminibacter litoriperuensis]
MPSDLIQIDRGKLEVFIAEKLGQFTEIAGVYLFGSALDKMRTDSDIDLGIILVPGAVSSVKELFLSSQGFHGRHRGGGPRRIHAEKQAAPQGHQHRDFHRLQADDGGESVPVEYAHAP